MSEKPITLLYGTGNAGKMNHMRGMLEGLPICIIGLSDITAKLPDIDESRNNPLENAHIKAASYFKATGMPVFSCDSGLYLKASAIMSSRESMCATSVAGICRMTR